LGTFQLIWPGVVRKNQHGKENKAADSTGRKERIGLVNSCVEKKKNAASCLEILWWGKEKK